jgi:hypothetical protein
MSDGVYWPEFEAWLNAHGIPAGDCYEITIHWTPASVHSQGQDGPVCMLVGLYRQDAEGKHYIGEMRMVPMRHLPAVEVIRYRTQPKEES